MSPIDPIRFPLYHDGNACAASSIINRLYFLAILSAIGIGFAIVKFEKNSDLCTANGGTVIETPRGYSCAKVEKIDLRKAQEKWIN